MPTLSFFHGIFILMFVKDHDPPHFHVRYAEFRGKYEIDPLRRVKGDLPAKTERLVLQWAQLHKAELLTCWEQRKRGATLSKIQGLP